MDQTKSLQRKAMLVHFIRKKQTLESTIVKSSVTAGFSFGVTKAESSAPFTQSRSDTPVSSFPAVTGSGSSFPVPEHGMYY